MTVPSQLMPEKPVPILSMTPSMTELITTSAKTPSIRSVSVSVERSLWAQSSTKPPLMISQASESFAPKDSSPAPRLATRGAGSARRGRLHS